jgi:inosine/xanthosine triphosphatase
MKIVITSKNPGKNKAARLALKKLLGDIEIISVDADSGVSNTPISDEEGVQGCLNRIADGKKQVNDADVYVGLEGIISKNKFGMFICGWAVVDFVKLKKQGIGCSAKVMVPDFISQNVEDYKELSEIVKQTYPSDLIDQMPEIASNGVISGGRYTRVDAFQDALACAIGYVQNESNWSEQLAL